MQNSESNAHSTCHYLVLRELKNSLKKMFLENFIDEKTQTISNREYVGIHMTKKTKTTSINICKKVTQVTKGIRWMPRRQEPMKDVTSCEKLRGVANGL